MTRMFVVNGKKVLTYNPISGCLHDCRYCWARDLVVKKLRDSRKYKTIGFEPAFHPDELKKRLGTQNVYFIVDMGDMWGDWVPYEWITAVVNKCSNSSQTNTYMFLTKNPARYLKYFKEFPDKYQMNFILGATIESDLDQTELSKAPPMYNRYAAMASEPLSKCRKFLSIEPIQAFTVEEMVRRVKEIKPEFVYIGYDNYNHGFREPSKEDTELLIAELKKITDVRLKTIR